MSVLRGAMLSTSYAALTLMLCLRYAMITLVPSPAMVTTSFLFRLYC